MFRIMCRCQTRKFGIIVRVWRSVALRYFTHACINHIINTTVMKINLKEGSWYTYEYS